MRSGYLGSEVGGVIFLALNNNFYCTTAMPNATSSRVSQRDLFVRMSHAMLFDIHLIVLADSEHRMPDHAAFHS